MSTRKRRREWDRETTIKKRSKENRITHEQIIYPCSKNDRWIICWSWLLLPLFYALLFFSFRPFATFHFLVWLSSRFFIFCVCVLVLLVFVFCPVPPCEERQHIHRGDTRAPHALNLHHLIFCCLSLKNESFFWFVFRPSDDREHFLFEYFESRHSVARLHMFLVFLCRTAPFCGSLFFRIIISSHWDRDSASK